MNNDKNEFNDKLENFDLNSLKSDWLKKEIEVKNNEITNLKNKNLMFKIFNSFKIIIALIFVLLQIFIVIWVLQRYNIIDMKDSTSSISVSKNHINIPVIDINEQLTMEYVNNLIKKMDKIKSNDSVKEVLIIMNCPGGSPVAADEFTAYIKEFNETKKINMYVQTMAASGGYYIASAIKPIVANPNAIVGSIGVIMPKYTIKKLADKIGIEEDNVVVGDYKVPASLFNNVTKEQTNYLKENMLNPTYKNFIEIVAKNREIEVSTIEEFAQGKIYVASKEEIKDILVDELSTLVEYKNKIVENLHNETKINKDKIKFILVEDRKEKLPGLNINLDVGNLIENNKLNLTF